MAGTKPGSVYYGSVSPPPAYWAVASFTPSAQALAESKGNPDGGPLVQFQDGPWVFTRPAGGSWRLVTDSGGMGLCPGEVPAPLSVVWALPTPAACTPASGPAAGPASSAGTTEACATWAAAGTFFHATRAMVSPGGSLTLTGHRVSVVCGGPDDLHYVDSPGTMTAHVVPGASIERIVCGTPKGCVDKPISAGQLPSYLTGTPETGVFKIKGPLTAITSMHEEYHP
ncbi:MAG TPA: hypothetical protein VKV80_05290 [Streptosporangiaceae bacterium]|nr:hypothetical protein [Streptosporangiaceae bacterium]